MLTHHPRRPIVMQGGTVFRFVTEAIEAALERAVDAAKDGDIRLGGGAATIREHLREGLIDDMHRLRTSAAPAPIELPCVPRR